MASHGFWPSTWHVLEAVGGAAGGTVGVVAAANFLLKRRELRLKTRETENAEVQREVNTAQSLTATALLLLEPVKHALAEAEERIKALQKQVLDLETAAQTLTRAMEALTAASQAERAELETRLAEVTAERDAAQVELAATAAERDALKAELDTYRRQNYGTAV